MYRYSNKQKNCCLVCSRLDKRLYWPILYTIFEVIDSALIHKTIT